MVCIGSIRTELGLFVLISLLAYSAGLRSNSNDDQHSQQAKVVSKRDSGFLPMRGRKNDEEFASNSNVERNSNEKEAIGDIGSGSNLDLVKTLNNFLKLNNNGNLEEQLSLIDQSYPAPFGASNSLHRGYEPFINRRFPLFNSRFYGPSQQITPFLGLMTRYGSPKRAGFVPMRGRKSDPNVLLTNDEDDDLSPYSFKRAGFLPMRGKKSINMDDLDQLNEKRAFHALRG